MTIVPCPRAFADFACEMRPDWDRGQLEGALTAAGYNRPEGRKPEDHWARTVNTVAPLLGKPEATPSDVLDAVRNPLRRDEAEPGATERGAALARQALGLPEGGER